MNDIEEEKQEKSNHDCLNDKEKEEARQNGFIIIGRTGSGKTTLINALFKKVLGKTERSPLQVTNEVSVYYYKLTNGKTVCLIDTPGTYDEFHFKEDTNYNLDFEKTIKIISKEKIHIKGILFLINFQYERFELNKYEEEVLLNYNTIFPVKNFWKNVVIIYTHFYLDPNEDQNEKEEIEEKTTITRKILEEKIKQKIKGVSDFISFKDLKIKFLNSYSEPKSDIRKQSNERTRQELESLFDEFSKNQPLISQIEIKNIKNYRWKESNNKEYIGEIAIIGFFDLNKEPIKIRINVIKKEELIKQQDYPSPFTRYYVYNATRSSNGSIDYQAAEGNKNNSKFLQSVQGGIMEQSEDIQKENGKESISFPIKPIEIANSDKVLGIGTVFDLFS